MSTRDASGFSITPYMQRMMSINGCYASIMKAEKKKEESDGGLPSGIPIPVLPVDYLKEHPSDWVGGEGSYVVPVDSNWGLWFNWTMNNPMNTSVLVSVKGMNPLTGQRMNGYTLEDTKEECPIHKTKFKTGKLCTECGFKWPAQNYISAPSPLYLDGFRQADGTVRQFFFTEDMACSIPELVIGKEDTVPAFGFCFYRRKKYDVQYEDGLRLKNTFPDNRNPLSTTLGFEGSRGAEEYKGVLGVLGESYTSCGEYSVSATSSTLLKPLKKYRGISKGMSECTLSSDTPIVASCYSVSASSSASASVDSISSDSKALYTDTDFSRDILLERDYGFRSAEVGIGAGARIKQDFMKSLVSLEDWKDKPEGIIRLYFVFQEQFEQMAEAGFNDLSGAQEGYLANLPVGGSK